MGPVVGELWKQEKTGDIPMIRADLDEAELNTIGYVVSRYGNLTGNDLEHLTHGESPWQLADTNRAPHTSAPIRREWIRDYFTTAGAPGDDEDEPVLDATQLKQWLTDALSRPLDTTPDDIDRLKARLAARV